MRRCPSCGNEGPWYPYRTSYCVPCSRRKSREYWTMLRTEMFIHLGDVCVQCGETDKAKLSLDHIIPLRRKRHHGGDYYAKARKEGWPKDVYQVLCGLCNEKKSYKV